MKRPSAEVVRAVTIKVPGTPLAKARPRAGRHTVFTPSRTVEFEAYVAGVAAWHLHGAGWTDSPTAPIRVDVSSYFALPEKLKKTKRVEVPGQYPGVSRAELKKKGVKVEKMTIEEPRWRLREQVQPHLSTPDRDNLEKAILDGLNKTTAWSDDACAFAGYTEKWWLPIEVREGFTLITLQELRYG